MSIKSQTPDRLGMTKETYGAAIQGAGWVSTQHVKAYMNNHHTKVVAISNGLLRYGERIRSH